MILQLNLHASSGYPIKSLTHAIKPKDCFVKVRNENVCGTVKLVSNDEEYSVNDHSTQGYMLKEDQFVSFQFDVKTLDNLIFKVELQTEKQNVGKGFLLWSSFTKHFGHVDTVIHSNVDDHTPVAHISFEYCIIERSGDNPSEKLYSPPPFSYLGHRGSGSTKSRDFTLLENTLSSFQKAHENGADFIELDIQLTKDFVPIVFHDFHVTLFPEKKDRGNSLCEALLKDLTYEQVKNYKLDLARPEAGVNHDERFNELCPTLKEVFDNLPKKLGIMLEVKFPYQCAKTGEWEVENFFDKNLIIDCVLEQVKLHHNNRELMFCTFDPEMCLMLRHKQSKYPVMFCTVGESERYVYMDIRNRSGFIAANFVINNDLAGVSISADEFFCNREKLSDLSNMLKRHGKYLFTYGSKNSEKEFTYFQKSIGITGIISDDVDKIVDES